jgi:O-antigen/teichoic acid export membrane protein
MSLRDKVRSGLLWTALVQLGSRALNLLAVAILARLLGPEAFGLLSMVLVVHGVVFTVSSMGIATALIHRRDLSDEDTSSLFWLNLGALSVCGAALCLAAPLVAAFFREPRILPLVQVSAAILVLDGQSSVPIALMRKHMKMVELGRFELVAMFVGASCAVGAAWAGLGVWSLIVQNAATAAVRCAMVFSASRFRPRWARPVDVGWAYRYGGRVMAAGLISQLHHSADRFVIGRYLGSGALGLYTRSAALADLVSASFVGLIGDVLFPALSSMDDDERVARAVQRAFSASAFVLVPASVGMVCVAPMAVSVLYGEQWMGAVPLFEALAGALLLNRLSAPVNTLFTVKGRPDVLLRWTLGAGALMVLVTFAAATYGSLQAVAFANAGLSAVLFVPRLYVAGRLVGLNTWRLLATLRGPVLCSAAMAGVVLGLRQTQLSSQPPLLQLVVLACAGAASYGLLAWRFELASFAEVRSLLQRGSRTQG